MVFFKLFVTEKCNRSTKNPTMTNLQYFSTPTPPFLGKFWVMNTINKDIIYKEL